MQNGSTVGYLHVWHRFVRAQSVAVLVNRISALYAEILSELSRNFIKSALLVGL